MRYIRRFKRSPYYLFHILSLVEFFGQARGVLREVWYGVYMNLNEVATMRQHPVFKTPPRSQMMLRDFEAPVDVADSYVQRLTSYLQVIVRFTIKTCSYIKVANQK